MTSTTKSKSRAAFVQQQPHAHTWEDAYKRAEKERVVMVAEFQTWLVKTRIKMETAMLKHENYQREIAPFARAGLDNAETPNDVPMVVLEFAATTLDLLDDKRKLALLNVFYLQASSADCPTAFPVAASEEAEFAELWDWFVEERNESAKD